MTDLGRALAVAEASCRVWARYRALPWWKRLITPRPTYLDALVEASRAALGVKAP